jgi:hypothetical protein
MARICRIGSGVGVSNAKRNSHAVVAHTTQPDREPAAPSTCVITASAFCNEVDLVDERVARELDWDRRNEGHRTVTAFVLRRAPS